MSARSHIIPLWRPILDQMLTVNKLFFQFRYDKKFSNYFKGNKIEIKEYFIDAMDSANNVYLNKWKTLRARVMIESFSIQHLEDVEEDFSLVQEGDLGKDYIRRKVKNTVKKNENTYELAILVSYNETKGDYIGKCNLICNYWLNVNTWL